jgi:hypothetical protein
MRAIPPVTAPPITRVLDWLGAGYIRAAEAERGDVARVSVCARCFRKLPGLGHSFEYGNAQNERHQDAKKKDPKQNLGNYGEARGNPGETEDPEDHSQQCANQCPFKHV